MKNKLRLRGFLVAAALLAASCGARLPIPITTISPRIS
jgi:hypothetical protein